jgi:hypothetical protein
MTIFKIGSADFSGLVSGLKVGYETLVSDNSGRNANGDTVLDVINMKRKIYVTLRHTTFAEMQSFLAAVEPFTVTVSYLDPKTNTLETATTYIGTPEPEYYNASHSIYKPLSLNFIEL